MWLTNVGANIEMKTLRAIETQYKGYRFRSRLEARWAVFFDALGIKWAYEAEGFDLPGVGRYLPDFFVLGNSRYGPYFEIKGEAPTKEELRKMSILCREKCAYGAILVGTPGGDSRSYHFFDKDGDESSSFYVDSPQTSVFPEWLMCFVPHAGRNDDWASPRQMEKAVRAARGSRFEFGELGAKKR